MKDYLNILKLFRWYHFVALRLMGWQYLETRRYLAILWFVLKSQIFVFIFFGFYDCAKYRRWRWSTRRTRVKIIILRNVQNVIGATASVALNWIPVFTMIVTHLVNTIIKLGYFLKEKPTNISTFTSKLNDCGQSFRLSNRENHNKQTFYRKAL